MSVLPIIKLGDPRLRLKGEPVDSFGKYLHELLDDLTDTMRDAPGVGLAAPQVGVQRRILVYDAGDGLVSLVNPQVFDRRGSEVDEEGCLSIPGLAFPVERALHIRVRGLDEYGKEVDYIADDFHARVVQHEVDHLDGVLFIDRLEPYVRREAMRTLRERAMSSGPPGPLPAPPL